MNAVLQPAELRARGFDALVAALGWVNAVRFIQLHEASRLNYTAERDAILPDWDASELARRAAQLATDDPGM
jgi:hypothetical protein